MKLSQPIRQFPFSSPPLFAFQGTGVHGGQALSLPNTPSADIVDGNRRLSRTSSFYVYNSMLRSAIHS